MIRIRDLPRHDDLFPGRDIAARVLNVQDPRLEYRHPRIVPRNVAQFAHQAHLCIQLFLVVMRYDQRPVVALARVRDRPYARRGGERLAQLALCVEFLADMVRIRAAAFELPADFLGYQGLDVFGQARGCGFHRRPTFKNVRSFKHVLQTAWIGLVFARLVAGVRVPRFPRHDSAPRHMHGIDAE